MMTAVVSHGNDAINLLFEAAQREESETSPTSPVLAKDPNSLPELSVELSDIWNAYRFVRMGWLSAVETVWLIDMYVAVHDGIFALRRTADEQYRFFKNMAPLSPILDPCELFRLVLF
jgi:hypothetical protein